MTDRGIFPDGLAEKLKARAGQKYRPSNGTEGEFFMGSHCDVCSKRDDCDIELNAFLFGIDDPQYPAEWQYGPDGQPTCTAFEEAPE